MHKKLKLESLISFVSRVLRVIIEESADQFVENYRAEKMALMRFDLPDLCDCGRCGRRCARSKFICGPTIVEKRTRCGSVTRKIGTYHCDGPLCTTTTTTIVPQPQVYLDYQNMCEVWYPPGTIEVTKVNPLTYQIGIPESMRGKLRINVDMIQDCPNRRRKEESYTINLKLDDE